ncbi:hypothetical protein Srubr_81930 [Streptomyces rubradiris]|uniref:Uncharacterized protein n=1 Tax=Streptomyces rubradiris TaxID=285531 RepID=A0ABQ3RR69_STRRR|nr:hypothetical protein Srubr_81930 [Streptomyces rubradiris]
MDLTTTDMRRSAADARCGRSAPSPYLEKLRRHGFVVLEPDGPDGLSLEDIMAPLGTAVSYRFGTQLVQEQRPGDRQLAVPDRCHTDARRRDPERTPGPLHRAGVPGGPGRGR